MKDQVIWLLNKKIRELQREAEVAKKALDLVSMVSSQRAIQLLTSLIQEIQDTL